MQYLKFPELVLCALRVCKLWSQMPLNRCFKPDRLSAIPATVLYVLANKGALPQVNQRLIKDKWPLVDMQHLNKFNVKHLASITSSIWNFNDMCYSIMSRHRSLFYCFFEYLTIKDVFFEEQAIPWYPTYAGDVSDLRFGLIFPASLVWRFSFGNNSPLTDVADFILRCKPPALKEMHFISKKERPFRSINRTKVNSRTLYASIGSLQIIKAPQFLLVEDLRFSTNGQLMYCETLTHIYQRAHRCLDFDRTWKGIRSI